MLQFEIISQIFPKLNMAKFAKLPSNIRQKGDAFELRLFHEGRSISQTFKTLREAKDEKARIQAAWADGRLPPNVRAKRISIADAIEAFQNDPVEKPRISAGKMYLLNILKEDLGTHNVLALTNSNVMRYMAAKQRREGDAKPVRKALRSSKLYKSESEQGPRALATMRKFYYALKTALEWHADKFGYDLRAFKSKIKTLPAWEEPRKRRLSPNEEARLLAACDKLYKNKEEWKRVILFALETAMRKQEILLATWSNVDFDKRYLNLPKQITKTNKERHVYLSKAAIALLRLQLEKKKDGDDRIFWHWDAKNCTFGQTFKRITFNANCNDFRFHDFRHEATSRLFERTSMGMMEIAAMTGHDELSTLKRYVNPNPQLTADKLDIPRLSAEEHAQFLAYRDSIAAKATE